MATIVNGVLRKTTQDMELNGEFWKIFKIKKDPQPHI